MDKLTMAHEFMMKKMETETIDNHWELFYSSWRYADAMQAEADKRKKEKQDKAKQEQQNYEDALNSIGKEWQPDWSQAPERATAWKISNHGVPMWLQSHNNINQPYVWLSDAPSFDYKGNWQNSLRKRPHGE